jgi:allantoicase
MHFTELADLASETLGGAVLAANDEFFAPKENLLKPAKPIFVEGKYTDLGKWMDGWETRRRRSPGYDWCIIRLGLRGVLRGVVADTAYFRGNYPESCSLEVCDAPGFPAVDQLLTAEWTEILPQSPLRGDSLNELAIETQRPATHLRFKIYPDGGVARLRAHGEVVTALPYSGEIDLAAMENGGLVVAASDMFFGSRQNLIMPGHSRDMSDGWETRRRRGPGNDWVVIRLGANGVIQRAEVDTSYFKGNYPDRCSLETCDADGAPREILLPETKLQAHTRHIFRDELRPAASASYVRFSIFPDGGVSRLRLFGRRVAPHIPEATLLACCGSHAWVKKMAESQPFATAEQMFDAADRIWWTLSPDDWREAFTAHPKIGEKNSDEQSCSEQSGMREAAAEIRARIAAGNRTYLERFGHIYIVCATGKSAAQMAEILESRLVNDPATELRAAAAEQRQITRLRLEKWLDERR